MVFIADVRFSFPLSGFHSQLLVFIPNSQVFNPNSQVLNPKSQVSNPNVRESFPATWVSNPEVYVVEHKRGHLEAALVISFSGLLWCLRIRA